MMDTIIYHAFVRFLNESLAIEGVVTPYMGICMGAQNLCERLFNVRWVTVTDFFREIYPDPEKIEIVEDCPVGRVTIQRLA